jgi:membrane associated rhomboid family serine protease
MRMLRTLLSILLCLLGLLPATCALRPVKSGALSTFSLYFGRDRGVTTRATSSVFVLNARKRSRYPVGGKRGGNRNVRIGGRIITVSATNIIIATNIVMFLLTTLRPRLKMSLMKSDRAIRYYGQNYRLLTALFVHGNIQHILMNSYSLYNIGPAVENAFGTTRYVLTYLASGLLANFVTYTSGSSPYSLGASGCTYGLIGALATYCARNRHILGQGADMMLNSLKQTMLINLMYGFSMQGIDNSAHIYGALSGALAAYAIGPRLQRFSRDGRSGVADRPLIHVNKYIRKISAFFFGEDNDGVNRPKKFYPKGRPNLT